MQTDSDLREYIDLQFTERLTKRIILQAAEDLKNETKYLRKHTQNTADTHKESALYFIRSRAFEELCDAVGWNWKLIKKAALS